MSLTNRIPGETVQGYVARQAELGGWPTLQAFGAKVLGASRRGVPTVEALAVLLGEDPADIEFDTPVNAPGERTGTRVAYRGERLLPTHLVAPTLIRFCPECVSRDLRGRRMGQTASWHRGWWDIAPISTCHLHGVGLLERCDCGEAIDFRRPLARHCRCGRFVGNASGSRRPVEETGGDRYVLGRLGVMAAASVPILDGAVLGEAIRACVAIGHALAGEGTGALLNVGFDAFTDWPRSFHRVLDRVGSGSEDRPGNWGAARHLGFLYNFLRQNRSEELTRTLAAEAGRFIDLKGIAPGRKVFGVDCGDGDKVNLRRFQRESGVTYVMAKRFLKERGQAIDGKGQPASIDPAVATELIGGIRGNVQLATILKDLGMGPSLAARLILGGYLKPLSNGRSAGGRHAFQPEEGEAMLARICASLKPTREKVTSLPDACRRKMLTVMGALDQIAGGKVRGRSIKGGGKGLESVGVVEADLVPRKRSGRSLTKTFVAQALGAKLETVHVLVAAGLLATDADGKPTQEFIDRFLETYAASSVVAAGLGKSPRGCIAFLKTKGVEPVIGPPVCRKVFYRRADLATVEFAALSQTVDRSKRRAAL